MLSELPPEPRSRKRKHREEEHTRIDRQSSETIEDDEDDEDLIEIDNENAIVLDIYAFINMKTLTRPF